MSRALAAGVAVESLATYSLGRPRAGIAIGWGAIPAPRIEEGVRRLASCLRASRPRG